MTEKQYGGATGRELGNKTLKQSITSAAPAVKEKKQDITKESRTDDDSNKEKIIKAGKIASEAKKYAKSFIKKDMLLVEIADKIEAKIMELGAKPAFPTCLSIDETAAHDTPLFNDTRKAHGLLKVDMGAHIDGNIADTAFSLDLEDKEENKKLILAAEKAVLAACKTINVGVKTREIGAAVEKEIKALGFTPINNLCGHSIESYLLHAGVTIPNYDNSQEKSIEPGLYAIEPFATTGLGKVKDGKPSGIYRLEKEGTVRDTFAREVLAFIYEEYQTLPFASRWVCKKFGSRALLAIKMLEQAGILHSYPQLIEIGGGKVAQAEQTIMLEDGSRTITTI